MKVFALKRIDNIRKRCSSGGAFYSIAEAFFLENKNNALVYGVCFDSEMNLVYQCVDNIQGCERFFGSRYVKPLLGDVYKEVIESLNGNKHVMFVGLPCHVYALKRIVIAKKANLQNLLLVDLICNGVPDDFFWKDYLKYLESVYKSKIIDFRFRFKGDENNPYRTAAFFENGFKVIDSNITASYNRLYLKKLIIRKTCYACPFKSYKRNSDITIGDFWGIDKLQKDYNDGNGVSMVICSTKKGIELLSNINECVSIVEYDSEIVTDFQDNLKRNQELPDKYEEFWNDYNRGMNYILKKYADGGWLGEARHILRHVYRRVKVFKK